MASLVRAQYPDAVYHPTSLGTAQEAAKRGLIPGMLVLELDRAWLLDQRTGAPERVVLTQWAQEDTTTPSPRNVAVLPLEYVILSNCLVRAARARKPKVIQKNDPVNREKYQNEAQLGRRSLPCPAARMTIRSEPNHEDSLSHYVHRDRDVPLSSVAVCRHVYGPELEQHGDSPRGRPSR